MASSKPPAFAAVVLVTAPPTFMATLDNLVVTNALPVIRTELAASLETLQWVVNAYTLAFATLLLTASALGDRLGRRRVFASGVGLFTIASAACALATDATTLIIARTVQGAAAAAIMPLALVLLASAVPQARRALAIGIWGGISGLGVALGPLIGGAVIEGASWEWIFWLNVPLGVIAVPLVLRVLPESRGPDRMLDPLGLLLSGGGVLLIVWAVVRSDAQGWTSAVTLAELIVGTALLVAFVAWQRKATAPLLPLRLYRMPGFAAANAVTATIAFGMFGAVFLLAQYFQVARGLSPLAAGVATMPWTLAPMIVAPLAGMFSARIGTRTLITTGLVLQAAALALLAWVTTADAPYAVFVAPFVLGGAGMGLTFAPGATAVLASVPTTDHGKASGTNSTLRELGVALGVAVLTAVFSASGSYTSGQAYVDGLVPALWVGAAVLAAGVLAARALPGRPAARQIPARDPISVG